MNTIWSTYLQKIGTLYQTRQLRFDDRFKENYISAFNINNAESILEIGAGPGALTQALKRWYPNAEVVGSDRDTSFIKFAQEQAPHIKFVEADINALPFRDNSFDVVISNTVQEHIEPSVFYGEQYRILKPGGVCLVLSARPGINITSKVVSDVSEFEKELWQRTEEYYKEADEKYNVGKYSGTEQELSLQMGKYKFNNVQTHYLTINLTPDSEQYDKAFATKMIEANRRIHLNSLEYLPHIAPDVVTCEEIKKWASEINQKFDKRLEQYNLGNKQWDANIALTMVLRGELRQSNRK